MQIKYSFFESYVFLFKVQLAAGQEEAVADEGLRQRPSVLWRKAIADRRFKSFQDNLYFSSDEEAN